MAVLLGSGVEALAAELFAYGAEKVILAEHEALAQYSARPYEKALVQLCEKHKPSVFLFAASAQGRDVAPRVMCSLRTGLTADAIDLDVDEEGTFVQTTPNFGGNILSHIAIPEKRPQMVTVHPRVFEPFEPVEGATGEIIRESVEVEADDCYELLGETMKSVDGKPIDEAIALVFRAPKSYTGEDTVELSCHGGVYIVRQVLRAALDAGAQPAGPGEFTKRAFLNGRIDLAKAESVMSLISAQGEQAASAAFNTLEGRLSGRIESVAHSIINVCAHLSAWVDYPDEDIEELSTDELEKTFSAAQSELESLISGFENGKAVTQGVDTVIVGRPNVGKSTLMNLLSGCERSIVTDVPGTTRDIVEQTVRVGENLLRLADTAGIRDTDNKIESIGVELAKKRLSRAELVIAVFDGAQKLTDEDMEIIDFCSGRRSLAVVNKSDLGFVCDTDYIKSRFGAYVELSAKTAQGGGELEKVLSDLLGTSNFDPSAAALTSERQRNCCVRALDSIKEARSALESGVTLDAVNVCADCAVDALLELTGERAGEAVVNEVFSQFCVGK
mgnify:CR=1 FL=1